MLCIFVCANHWRRLKKTVDLSNFLDFNDEWLCFLCLAKKASNKH